MDVRALAAWLNSGKRKRALLPAREHFRVGWKEQVNL